MDIHFMKNLSEMVYEENVIVREINIADSSDFDAGNGACEKNITARSLLSLLSSQLGTKAFYFVSGRQKHVPNGDLNNGVITREAIDFDLSSNTNRSNSTGCDDCSMFGSPLKLQTIANLSGKTSNTSTPNPAALQKRKDFASPIPLSEARKILSKFSQTAIQESCVNMMAVFCDGNDHNRTILLGGKIEDAENGKAITTFRVTVDKVKLPDLEESATKIGEQGYQLTAKYNILEKLDGLGSVILEARWSDPLGRIKKLTKLQSAEFFLHIDVASGCDQSPVFNYYCQLQKVQTLLEGLKTGLPEVLTQKTQNAVIQLKEVLTRMKDGVNAAKNILSNEDSKSTAIAGMLCGTARQLNLESSADSDFTDILWQIVRNCTDISDLVQCLNTTFFALKKGDLKVFVHKANQTTIAKLVRQSYCGMASFPSLTRHLSLRLAVEIGMEKIRKDYYAVFINNGLCTLSQWNSFFHILTTPQEEVLDMEELNIQLLEAQFDILSKLHHCLEIVSVVDSFTEKQDLQTIAKNVLNLYKCGKFDRTHCFTIPITALQASPEVRKHPLCSIKRESLGTGQCNVISLISELPDEFAVPSLSALLEAEDVSFVGDSKEYYMFRSQEHTLYIDWAENHV